VAGYSHIDADERQQVRRIWDAALSSKPEQSEWTPTPEDLAKFGVRITEMGPGDWIASAGEEGGAGFGNTREWAMVSLCGSLAAQLKVQSAQPALPAMPVFDGVDIDAAHNQSNPDGTPYNGVSGEAGMATEFKGGEFCQSPNGNVYMVANGCATRIKRMD